MGAADLSAAGADRRSDDPVGRKRLHKQADADYISHRVKGADFVEMYLADGLSVGAALSLR